MPGPGFTPQICFAFLFLFSSRDRHDFLGALRNLFGCINLRPSPLGKYQRKPIIVGLDRRGSGFSAIRENLRDCRQPRPPSGRPPPPPPPCPPRPHPLSAGH